jgi:hypothetical protein
MSTPLATALPYGLRDIKLTPYSDAGGTTLGSTVVDLPNARTLSFSETEEFEDLRGDDRVVTTRGKGAVVEWELEAGGLNLDAWKAMSGGTIIDSGTTPNKKRVYRKAGRQNRPWFLIEGQVISDSGGDIHAILYRCRATDSLEGEFNDGEFFLTSGSGQALPLLEDGVDDDILYDIIQNETAVPMTTTALTLPDPEDNDAP